MTDLQIINGLMKIKSISGTNDRTTILKTYTNENFKKVLKYLYDNQYVFGLSTKKISKKVNVELKQNCKTLLETFEYLEKNNTGTDFDIFVVQNYIKNFFEENAGLDNKEVYEETLKEMFCKKYKIGVTDGTLEKVYPDLFTKFEVMAGEPYFDRIDKIKQDNPTIILTQKLDGIRCLARIENGSVKLFARSGKAILGLNDLESELSKLPDGVYDGELLKLINNNSIDVSKFPEKSVCHKLYFPKNAEELYSETVSIVNSKNEDKKDIGLFLFDMITLENFDKKEQYNIPASIRKQKLEMLLSTYKFNFIKYVPIIYEGIFEERLIKKYLDEVVLLEQEGLMLNYATAPYEFKRTNNLVKVKQVYTADVKVRGYEEGSGKNKGKLGAFIIKTPQGVEVKVGSGIDDETRKDVWEKQAGYIGCVMEIAFTTPSTNKNDNNYNLRFPRFVGWRTDKTEENWEEFDKIIEQLERNKK